MTPSESENTQVITSPADGSTLNFCDSVMRRVSTALMTAHFLVCSVNPCFVTSNNATQKLVLLLSVYNVPEDLDRHHVVAVSVHCLAALEPI